MAGGTVDKDAAAVKLKLLRQAGLRRLPDGQHKQVDRQGTQGTGKLHRFHRFAPQDAAWAAHATRTSLPQALRARIQRQRPTSAPGRAGTRCDTSLAPSRTEAMAASIAVFPAPITTTRGGTLVISSRLVAGDQIERVGHAGQVFAGDPELVNRAQPNAQEDGIMLAFEFSQPLRVDHGIEVKLHSELREHFDFAQTLDQRQFVFGDSVGIQAPW